MPQTSNRKKKRRKWPWLILLAVVIAAAVLMLTAGKRVADAALASETAQVRDLVTYYSFSGNLTPVTDETQSAKTALKVKEVYVSEGDNVKEGDALLRAADGTRVFAAYTGTIEKLHAEVDDQLQIGSAIARIVDYDSLEVTVDVDEYDIGAITEGKEGTVYLNALDRSVPGTVTDIARSATSEGGVSYFEVKLRIDAPSDVRSGMSVEVNILNERADGALSVSLDSLSYDEYNRPFVYVKDKDGNLASVSVDTGVSDGKNIQVLSGLSEGDTVYYQSNDFARFFQMRMQSMKGN